MKIRKLTPDEVQILRDANIINYVENNVGGIRIIVRRYHPSTPIKLISRNWTIWSRLYDGTELHLRRSKTENDFLKDLAMIKLAL